VTSSEWPGRAKPAREVAELYAMTPRSNTTSLAWEYAARGEGERSRCRRRMRDVHKNACVPS